MPLSDVACRNAKAAPKPQKLADSGGLYLFVAPTGGKLWRCDYRHLGKRRTASLGAYPVVSLAEARKRRDEIKGQLAAGADPSAERRATKRAAVASAQNSFESVAREWFVGKLPSWTPSYSVRLMSRLEADIFPKFGARPISSIEPPEVLEAVRKVEARGAIELAKREMQVTGQIFRFAVATGRTGRDPTRDLVGALKSAGRAKHHATMPLKELPGFLKALGTYDGDPRTRLALGLIVLTFVRTTELRAARWTEFEDLGGKSPLWRIPAARMKMRFEHLVPLPHQAIEMLAELRQLAGRSEFVFPSPAKEGFMSNNTMLFAMYRLGFHGRATVHGFRGLASTWLNERGYAPDWIERQLAHDERNEVRGAYNSAQYLPGRREMMTAWADYLDSLKAADDPN